MRITSINLSYNVYERDAFSSIYYRMGTNEIVSPLGFSVISKGVHERGDEIIETYAFIVSLIIIQNRMITLPPILPARMYIQK